MKEVNELEDKLQEIRKHSIVIHNDVRLPMSLYRYLVEQAEQNKSVEMLIDYYEACLRGSDRRIARLEQENKALRDAWVMTENEKNNIKQKQLNFLNALKH